jgi:hypothetical protein
LFVDVTSNLGAEFGPPAQQVVVVAEIEPAEAA